MEDTHMTMTDRKTTWMVKHVDELPVERLEGIRVTRVLEGTAFDNIGCEYVVLERGQSLDSHVHEEAHSFILVLHGSGVVELEGKVMNIREGSLVYVPAGVPHAFRTVDDPIVMYGFQSPPIIKNTTNVDIVFERTGEQGKLTQR
jgi:quercetin dioxygenase-like cupin family protein